MKLFLYSNGAKYGGVGSGAISAKGLDNPYHNRKLRALNGLHPAVQADVMKARNAEALVAKVIERALQDGEVTVYCHAGRHRSVSIIEVAAQRLRAAGHEVHVLHACKDRWP